MKTCINGRFFKRFLFIGILSFGVVATVPAQLKSTEQLEQILGPPPSHIGFRPESNDRGVSNQPDEAKIQRQLEKIRQKEEERLEKLRQFEIRKQNLRANLKGMPQKTSAPLPLTIGMYKKHAKNLELIEINSSQKSPSDIVIDDTRGLPSVRPSAESERLWGQYQRDKEAEDRLAQIMSMQRREEDRLRYENETPEYQKKIDRYDEKLKYEDLSLSETIDAVAAHTVKGMVVSLDFVADGIPKLVMGQTQKEVNTAIIEGASSVLELLTEGRWGKAEVNVGKGLYGAGKKYIIFQKDGAKKIADAYFTGNVQKIQEIEQNTIYEPIKEGLKAINTYTEEKTGGGIIPSPQTVSNLINGNTAKNDVINAAIKISGNKSIKYFHEGGDTFVGMEQHIRDNQLK